MKYYNVSIKMALTLLVIMGWTMEAEAQFLKKLGKAAERAAERTVERRVEKETTEKTDQALDSILEPGSGKKERPSPVPNDGGGSPPEAPSDDRADNEGGNAPTADSGTAAESISVYGKFDFVPGDKIIFYDDFSKDFIGDFPSKFDATGGGELVEIDGFEHKWLRLLPGYSSFVAPLLGKVPDEFTMEFDVITTGIDGKTSSNAHLRIVLSDSPQLQIGQNMAYAEYPFCQYSTTPVTVDNKVAGKRTIRTDMQMDIRKEVLEPHHISIAVNGQRFRMWLNEMKLVDVPRLVPEAEMQNVLLHLLGTDTQKENVYIGNVKIAEGGVDLRRKLLEEGKISTTAILFESGSATLKPQSMGMIRQIYQVMQQEGSLRIKVIGHTDADGDDSANMALSKKRAEAVKDALVSVYGVGPDRLDTEGKGESEPVGDNNSPDGKAQNRRVEFVTM